MNRNKKLSAMLMAVLAAALMCSAAFAASKPTLKALIVTGQNNHDWKTSSPILKQILENTGLFTVDVATSPAEGAGGMENFKPDFAAYNVVVLDYTGDAWCPDTQNAFVKYVAEGGGVVVYHAADNAFPDWPEFNKIIGLGGWGGRDEKSGPYIRWRDGAAVRDDTPGPGGNHGAQHAFQLIAREPNHPIMKGLPAKWMHAQDELYDHLRGPAENLTILATAYSAPEQRGSGENEPILFAIAYGKGRVFHTVMGHAGGDNPPPAMQCAGFIVTLQRGAEWAATGKVTQKVPDDFPSEKEVRSWKEFRAVSYEELLSKIATYEFGQSLEPLMDADAFLRAVVSARKPLGPYEKKLLELLKSNATQDAKRYACKKLSEIGTQTAVPVLAAMLPDPQTSDMARYALERIPGEASSQALRDALPLVSGKEKIGIIASLGVRKDRKAVPALAELTADPDSQIAAAVLSSLANIGDDAAVTALTAAKAQLSGDMRATAVDAYLRAAEAVLAKGRGKQAAEMYRPLLDPAEAAPTRVAAMRGLVRATGSQAAALIIETLKGGDTLLQSAAIGAIQEIQAGNALAAIAKELPGLAPDAQVQLLAALAEKGGCAAAAPILAMTGQPDAAVRLAALKALAATGDAACVMPLAQKAACQGEEAQAANATLHRMRGADIEGAIIAGISGDGDVKAKMILVQCAADRKLTAAGPALLAAAISPDAALRASAIQALRAAGAPDLMPNLVQLVVAPPSPEDGPELVLTTAEVARKVADPNARAAAVLAALPNVTDLPARTALFAVLGKIGDPNALPVLQTALSDPAPELRTAAVAALADWPDDAPRAILLDVARQSANTPDGAAALAGCVRLIGLPSSRAPEETVKLYEEVLVLAADPAQKEVVLNGLAATKHAAALPLLYGALNDPDDAVKTAAIKALSDWPDGAPMAEIRTVAQQTANETHKVLALRGLIRLIGLDASRSPEEAAGLYQEAMALAPNAEVQKAVLSGLANTPNIAALRIAAANLDNESLHEEAEVAVVKIAKPLAGAYAQEVKAILAKVLEKTQIEFVRNEASAILESIKQFEEYLTAWEVSEAYTQEKAGREKLFDIPFAPETNPAEAKWQPIAPGTNKEKPFFIELDKALGGNDRVAYLRCRIWSDQAQEALLLMGSDDGVRVWLNGQEAFANNAARDCKPDDDKAKIQLQAGWNAMLVKITQAGGEWIFCGRICKPDGSPLDAPLRVEPGAVPAQ